jgi:hypothetical protein
VITTPGALTRIVVKNQGTMTLHFSKKAQSDPATGISETTQVPFWCDIHQHMKGEFLVVETKGEVGGG